MRTPILQIGLLLLALPEVDASAAERASAPVHQFGASPQGLSVNCYVVEGRRGLVAIDSALTVSDSKSLRAKVDALGKPLLAVLLTHGHPDHYNGVAYLIEGRTVPVYATASVAKVIREWDGAKEKQWTPVFGPEWPSKRAFPDHEVNDGDKISFDELQFVVHDLGPAESYADSYWELVSPERAAFIGDEVLNGSHAYTSDGHTTEWMKNLDRLSRALNGVTHVYPGHGPAGDTSLFKWEKQYLTKYRKEVEALRAGGEKLNDEHKKTLVTRMKAAYPTAGNEFLIALGADAVAAELAQSHSKGPK